MQVLLQDPLNGLYYVGREARTSDPLTAFDFGRIDNATRQALAENLAAMRIILNYSSPPCQLALPVNPEWIEAEQTRVA